MKRAMALVAVLSLSAGVARAADDDQDNDSVLDVDEFVGDTDGDLLPDIEDDDDDDDGILTLVEVQRAPPSGNTDGDALPDYRDDDDDGDGLPTAQELGEGATPRNTDNDALFDYLDPDDDNDGEPTSVERASAPPEPDVNLNGIPDHLDAAARGSQWPSGIPRDADCAILNQRLLCWGYDQDGDGLLTRFEANESAQPDTDGDMTPDFLDADDDNDGLPTAAESADPNHDGDPADALQSNVDVPNYLTADDDGDSVPTRDERPNDQNRDTDGDLVFDHLDQDDDGDGVPTLVERGDISKPAPDANGDGIPDYLDANVKRTESVGDAGVAGRPDGSVPVGNQDAGVEMAGDAGAGASDASVTRDGGAGAGAMRDAATGNISDEDDEGASPARGKGGDSCSTHAGTSGSSAWLLGISLLGVYLATRRRNARST